MKQSVFLPAFRTASAALLVVSTAVTVPAQDDSVTVSATEFQQMVYSAHLLTQLDQKPELDAGLQVMLALHRRNPHADPGSVSGLIREALAEYRTGAPTRILPNPWRDEILSAYLEVFSALPGRTNLNPATLSLLHRMCYRSKTPDVLFQSERLHAGNQRLLTTEDTLEQRRLLVESCLSRANGNPGFAETLDLLLAPETGVLLAQSPAQILAVNASLGDTPTMRELLSRSDASDDGSVTISTNLLQSLFVQEMEVMHQTINSNRAVHLEISGNHTDLSSYLDNPALVAANLQRETQVKEGQSDTIAAAHAGATTLATLTQRKMPRLASDMRTVASSVKYASDSLKVWSEASKLMKVAACGNLVAAGLNIFSLFLDQGPSPEEMILEEIGVLKDMINELRVEMHSRFDQVDGKLNTILQTLSDNFDEIDLELGQLDREADVIRKGLLDIQTDLHRLERNLYDYLEAAFDEDQVDDLNFYLAYEEDYGTRLSYDSCPGCYTWPENRFHTLGFEHAKNPARSPVPSFDELQDDDVYVMLTTRNLESRLNYLNEFISSRFLLPPPGPTILANPRDWFVGAQAYLQLALENPDHFRRHPGAVSKLTGLIANGNDLEDFFGNLTLTEGGAVNWPLQDALLGYYSNKLDTFLAELRDEEQSRAAEIGFPSLEMWRQWDEASPRAGAWSTELLASHRNAPTVPRDGMQVAAGGSHSLALRSDGTVIGWGDNTDGQVSIPPGATNVTALAAGSQHSLALNADGTVLNWGNNDYFQCARPAHATNVVAIAAGHFHNLALRSDGTLLAWGAGTNELNHAFPNYRQAVVPAEATNVVSIAAGGYHSLALRADGTLLPWGLNNEGQLDIPAAATNVVAIAAGHGHNLVLRSNGTLVAWGNNLYGSTNVPPEATNIVRIAAAGWHCLAERADGTLLSWGWNNSGQTQVPPDISSPVAFSAGRFHNLALIGDGTVRAWGDDSHGQCTVRRLTWRKAIALGEDHGLALRADGTVVGWGDEYSGCLDITTEASNVVAIAAGRFNSLALMADGTVSAWGSVYYGHDVPAGLSNVVEVAAGSQHNLALLSDGTLVGWGANRDGQATGVPTTTSPYAATGPVTLGGQLLSNVATVVAGPYYNLALLADRRVVAWGDGEYGQTSLPADLTNVVALAAGGFHGLALDADGRVTAWGLNNEGQTNVPAGLSNVVSIAAGSHHSLALTGNGTVVAWGYNGYGETNVPAGLSNVVEIAAGRYHSLALQADGTLVAWGWNDWLWRPRWPVPEGLTNVVAIDAGLEHCLALKADGTVVVWGSNTYSQTNVPAGLSNIVAIAAGDYHNVVLRADGTAEAWGVGYWDYGQDDVPAGLNSIVAITASAEYSAALLADGTVVSWGRSLSGVPKPANLTNAVAISASRYFNTALRVDGTVAAWGDNYYGACNVPSSATNIVGLSTGGNNVLGLRADGTVVAWGTLVPGPLEVPAGLSNVVSVELGYSHALALRADGTVVTWGYGNEGQLNVPARATNVLDTAGGYQFSLYLKACDLAPVQDAGVLPFVRGMAPVLVRQRLGEVNAHVLTNLNSVGPLNDSAMQLSGADLLVEAITALALPYTLEEDDVLHASLYGDEGLVQSDVAASLVAAEAARLNLAPHLPPRLVRQVALDRLATFAERLRGHLNELAQAGQPEIPRLVGHTIRLLTLLRDSWARTPASAIEISREPDQLRLRLYGEPYARYTLQETWNLADWVATPITDLRSADSPLGPVSVILPDPIDPEHYYRAEQP